jgi:RimJ/RimL family protein N-acetyltransferase
VVWFGEILDEDVVARSLEATRCDVFLTVGTSAIVYPAAGLIDHARRHGAMTVEINPEATPASSAVDVVLAGRAELALPALDASLPPHPLALWTPRLHLEPLLPRDAGIAHALWTHPEVRRYLWDDAVISRDTAANVTRGSARDFAARRFGLWLLFARDSPGSLVGFCGLRTDGVGDEPELLFGLHPDYWRRGLAQEAARAVLRHAFTTSGLRRVIAATDVPNVRSARTLAALGLRFDRRADHNGLDTFFYSIEAGPPLPGGGK